MPFPFLPKLDGSTIRLFSKPRKRPTLEIPAQPSEAVTKAFRPISPFDRLPVELQVEIFSHCFPLFPRLDASEGPLLVGRVCTAWRSVLLSTPKFWSSFEIEISGVGSSTLLRDIQIVSTMELWLQRSRTYPLSVRVIHIPVGRIPDPRSAQLLALLIPEARRWRHVQFIIPTANVAGLRQSLPNEFPSLRSLTLQMKGLWTSEPSTSLSTVAIPWSQLTSLDLQLDEDNMPNLNSCLVILSQMDQAKECTLSTSCDLDPTNGVTVYAASLKSLHLILNEGGETPASSFSQFLGYLSIPYLESLDLQWRVQSTRSWSTAHHGFTSFLRGISSTLRSLKISYLPLSDEDLLDCLAHTPLVEDLDLRFSLIDIEEEPITDRLLTALTPPPIAAEAITMHVSSDPPLLPCLSSLSLECNGSRLSFTALLDMIHSRRRQSDSPFTLLSRLRVRSMKPIIKEAERQIVLWDKEGMDIIIATVSLL